MTRAELVTQTRNSTTCSGIPFLKLSIISIFVIFVTFVALISLTSWHCVSSTLFTGGLRGLLRTGTCNRCGCHTRFLERNLSLRGACRRNQRINSNYQDRTELLEEENSKSLARADVEQPEGDNNEDKLHENDEQLQIWLGDDPCTVFWRCQRWS